MSNYKKAYQLTQEAGKKSKEGIWTEYKKVLENSFIFTISNPLTLLLSMTDSDFDEENLPMRTSLFIKEARKRGCIPNPR